MSDDLLEKIEQYLAGTLPEGEVSNFEKAVLADPELAEALRTQVLNSAAIEQAGEAELRDTLKKRGIAQFDEEKANNENRVRPLFRWAAIAAAIALLASIVLLLAPAKEANLAELYAEHYTEVSFPVERSENVSSDSLWIQARQAYEQEDYTTTLDALNSYIETNAKPQAFLYKGISLLQLNQASEAIQAFKEVPKEHIDHQRATWFIALSYLQAEDKVGAQKALEVIGQNPSHYKRKIANDILAKLGN